MREYGLWCKLSTVSLVATASLMIGCEESTYPNDDVAPGFMGIGDLAFEYEDKIGDEIILEGQLIVTDDGRYFLVEMTDEKQDAQDFRIALNFEVGDASDDRMKRCISGPTLVTGVLQESNEIKVKYVRLTSDTRVHRPVNCYDYSDQL